MKEMLVCLDVGGTEIKAAVVAARSGCCGQLRYFPARAEESAEVLLEHLAGIVREQVPAGMDVTDLCGVRMAFPGPFDYEEGICLLRGLDKYDKLYGVNLRRELSGLLGIAWERILFANDASAFALGEMGFGEARGAARALFLCIGTGCGSAFGMDGYLAPPGTEGMPKDGYIYHVPFLDGCLDDYLSRRGLMALAREHLGTALDGKALAERVRQGDCLAEQCFLAFGQRIRDGAVPFLDSFRPEVLCFGGQIMGSAPLFLPPVEEACRERGIRLSVTQDTSLRTLQGLTRVIYGGEIHGKTD